MVLAMNAAAQPIGFPVPLDGFSEAFAGKPVDNAEYKKARGQLMAQIRLRQAEAYEKFKAEKMKELPPQPAPPKVLPQLRLRRKRRRSKRSGPSKPYATAAARTTSGRRFFAPSEANATPRKGKAPRFPILRSASGPRCADWTLRRLSRVLITDRNLIGSLTSSSGPRAARPHRRTDCRRASSDRACRRGGTRPRPRECSELEARMLKQRGNTSDSCVSVMR